MSRQSDTKLERCSPVDWCVIVLLLAGVFVSYWPALQADFVNYDDELYVTRNPAVRTGLSLANICWAWTTIHGANWHPVTWMSLQLDATLGDANPFSFHFTNIVLHGLNSCLLFLALRRMTGNRWASAWTAAIFAWHPLHVESVAWVSERKDVLSTVFFMLAILVYVRYVRTRSPVTYALLIVMFALGLLAKPMLVTMPALLLLLDYWPLGRWPLAVHDIQTRGRSAKAPLAGESRRRLFLEKAPLFILAALSAASTVYAQSHGKAVISSVLLGFTPRLANAGISYCRYLGMLIWPEKLAAFYPHPAADVLYPWGWVSWLAIASITVAVFRISGPYFRVGWFWYIVTLLPVIGLVQVGSQALADRYTYIPSIGIFIAVAWAGTDLARGSVVLPRMIAAAGVISAIVALALTSNQAATWHDSIRLWKHALEVDPNVPVARYNLGQAMMELHQDEDALRQFQEAQVPADKPTRTVIDSLAELRIGEIYENHGDLRTALEHYRKAIAPGADSAEVYYSIGHVQALLGRRAEAIAAYREAIRMDPDYSTAHNNLGQLLAQAGYRDQAIHEFTAGVTGPDSYAAHYNLGATYAAENHFDDAVRHFKAAIELKPDFAPAHNGLGIALCMENLSSAAEPALRRSCVLAPANAKYAGDLAHALFSQPGKRDEARACYQRAQSLDPAWARMTGSAAWTLATSEHRRERNGLAALRLAQQLNEAGPTSAWTLDVLAAALAENGNYSEAVRTARQALEQSSMSTPEERSKVQDRIRSYQAQQPWRDHPSTDAPAH